MYCVNCGKQVNDTIPICQDCALLVLHNNPNNSLSKRVALEAEDFKVMSETKDNILEQQCDNNVSQPLKETQTTDDSFFPWFELGLIVFTILILIIGSSLV